MKMKSFFTPTPTLLIIFILLFGGSYFYTTEFHASKGGQSSYGFPLPFYLNEGCTGPDNGKCWDSQFLYAGFFVDAAIWYAIAWLLSITTEKIIKYIRP
jgi:hypothetical protein